MSAGCKPSSGRWWIRGVAFAGLVLCRATLSLVIIDAGTTTKPAVQYPKQPAHVRMGDNRLVWRLWILWSMGQKYN